MKSALALCTLGLALTLAVAPLRADDEAKETTTKEVTKKEAEKPVELKAKTSRSEGSVTVEG